MTRTILFFSTVLVGAGIASAQVSSLSSNCNNALTTVAADSDSASCLSVSSLISLLVAGEDSSIIDPVDTWLQAFCAAPACSNSTIADVVSTISSGCSAELSVLGLSSSDDLTTYVQGAFPTVKSVLCLEDSGTNCVTQDLTTLQDSLGTTLSINNIVSLVSENMSGSTTTIPTNVTCSNCSKAAYNIVNQDYPSLLSQSTSAQDTCGADFVDGQTPSGITETASTSTQAEASTSTDGAFTLAPQAMLAIGVSAIASLWTGMFLLA